MGFAAADFFGHPATITLLCLVVVLGVGLGVWYFCHASEKGRALRRQITREKAPEPDVIHMWHTPHSITAGRGEGIGAPNSAEKHYNSQLYDVVNAI